MEVLRVAVWLSVLATALAVRAMSGLQINPKSKSQTAFVFGAVLLTTLCNRGVFGAVAGPYTVNVYWVGTCPSEEVESEGDCILDGVLRHDHNLKDELYFQGAVEFKNNIFVRGNSKVVMDFAKWDSVSGWRKHYLVMPVGDLCFLAEVIGKDVLNIVAKTVPGFPKKCPFPNRIFNITHTPAILGMFYKFPSFPYGRFRVHILTYHNKKIEKLRACIKLLLDVIPKVRNQPS